MNALESLAAVAQIDRSGGDRPAFPYISWRGKPGYQVLLYHRICVAHDPFFPGISADSLAQQVSYLASHYNLVDLHDLIHALRQGDSIPANSVALTFDDGYRDNYELGLPILQQYDAPATVFLTTSFVNQDDVLWNDKVSFALKHTRKTTLCLSHNGGTFYALDTPQARLLAVREILLVLRETPHSERLRLMEELFHQLEVKHFGGLAPSGLTWDQVREMQEHRISFGAHTVTHPILSRLPLDQARKEIVDSRKQIESELDRPVELFAYPDGGCSAFDDNVVHLVRQAGFSGAVTTVWGNNSSDTDHFMLYRIGIEEQDLSVFASKLCWYKFWL